MQEHYSTGEVARLLGVQQHQIDYAIASGHLKDARCRFLGKRCFDLDEVRLMAKHFGVSLPEGGNNVQV